MSLKFYSNIEKINADDVRVRQLADDTDGIIAAYYDLSGNPSLFMSGASATLGNVGIKTEVPGEALTINGNVSASGGYYGDGSHLTNVQTLLKVTDLVSTTKTLALSDVNSIITGSHTANMDVYVPANSAVSLPIGTEIKFIQLGNNKIHINANAGVDLANNSNHFKTEGQHAVCWLFKVTTNQWIFAGDTGP